MKTLNDLITTKQQEARKLLRFNLAFTEADTGDYDAIATVQDALILSTAHSVLDAVKELVPEKMEVRANDVAAKSTYFHQATHFNLCRKNVLSRLERFSSNDT